MNAARRDFIVALAATGASVLLPRISHADAESFESWLSLLRDEAIQKGVKPETARSLLPDTLQPLAMVQNNQKNQPEKKQDLAAYLKTRVTPYSIDHGRQEMYGNAELLDRIEQKYGVPPQLIMSVWAMETAFGKYTGTFDVIQALVTLAQGRPEFRDEVFKALKMVDEGYTQIITEKGSWAGAFGQTQFMPSSFERLAVDGDGDGRKDIWHNLADIFASTANHLKHSGWNRNEPWGVEVVLPPDFSPDQLTDLIKERPAKSKSLSEWAGLGVRPKDGAPLPSGDNPVALIAPDCDPKKDNAVKGRAFVVFDNFWAIMGYNPSYKYAIAVNTLADAIAHPKP